MAGGWADEVAASGASAGGGAARTGVHLDETPGHGLDVRAILGLATRTLPYLRPVLRELRPLLFLLPLLVLIVPAGMLGTDLVLNRMLAGNPLTEFEGSLLGLPAADFVHVEKLSIAAREHLRGQLVWTTMILFLLSSPLAIWVIYLFIKIQQRINQILRVQMVENVQAQSLRFHQGSRVGDSVYRTYQDSSMVTNLMGMLVRPIFPFLGAIFGLALAALFDWRLSVGLALLCAFFFLSKGRCRSRVMSCQRNNRQQHPDKGNAY